MSYDGSPAPSAAELAASIAQARAGGRIAHALHIGYDHCPFSSGPLRFAWETGHRDAQDERAAFDRVVASARRLVRCADEFCEDYPEACGEDLQALDEAMSEYGRACDKRPDAPPVNIEVEP